MSEEKRVGTIIILSTAYLPFLGGAETAIKGITDKIDDFDFILFTSRFNKKLQRAEKIGNVYVYRLGFGNLLDKYLLPFAIPLKFFKLKKEINGPVIFWGMMISFASIAAFFLKLIYPKIPFLLTVQEGDSEEHIKYARAGLIAFFWKLLIRRADRIQVISEFLKDLCINFGAKAPVEVIPNGVDFLKFTSPDPQKTLILRGRLGIRANDRVIISVSRLSYKNGIDVLIRSFSFLKIPAKLLIVGSGEDAKKLSRLAYDLRVDGRVFFEESKHDNVPNYLRLANVFVRPSRSEGLCTSFLESMAAGVPIIATSVGGIKDFLKDNETGLAVRIDDPRDIAEKIELFFSDENLQKRLQLNGRKLVKEKYEWSNIALRMKHIFKELIFSNFPSAGRQVRT